MASQEEYLDQILKEMMDGGKSEPAQPKPVYEEEPESDEDDAPGEDEIERMLAEARAGADEPQEDQEIPENQDLMELLAGTGDGDMEEVHDLLQKSDENIAVDDAIFEPENEEPDLDAVLAEPEQALSPREQKKLEREKIRAQKAAARAEAKARKKEAAAARKAAREEKKRAKHPQEIPAEAETPQEPEQAELPAEEPQHIPETGASSEPMEVDMSDMDALLGLGNMIPDVSEKESADGAAEEPEVPIAESILSEEAAIAAPDEAEPETAAADDGLADENLTDQDAEQTADGEPPKKTKKGFLAKILELLTEEPLDEEEEQKGTEDIPLSDENKEILEELDQEDGKGKKGGKGKKEKKKKEKKPKEKKAKEPKPKKPKKEKPPKEDKPGEPKKKIPFKKILPLIFLGITVFAAIFLIVKVGGSAISKFQAKQAFYKEDYETCYQELYGKDLNESEQVMYAKSESILRINLWMREYEIYVEEGSEVEALDVLIQAVEDYPLLETYASEWNAYSEVRAVYEQMLSILSEKYHLTEAQAQAIAEVKDDEEYTRQVTAMAQGQEYDSWNEPVYETEQLPDMLPEEQNFQENQVEVTQ